MLTPIEYFKEISAIPRGSGNEAAVADYIESVARAHSLFCVRDALNNVFVRKNASKELSDAKPILFTAHTDMVCEKIASSSHDFTKDGLQLIEKDGFLYANGTTLGADNGAGVAIMLALMTNEDLIAPVTEYLFTSSEETGMYGAFGFDYSVISTDLVINLDNGLECSACVGSASGQKYEISIPVDRTPKCGKPVKISVMGLASGHSGGEIDSGNQSAIKILSSLLCEIYENYPFNIAKISGGGKDNVIPANAEAIVFLCGSGEEKAATEIAAKFEKNTRKYLNSADKKNFKIRITKLKEVEKSDLPDMMTFKSTSLVLSTLSLAPQGVIQYFPNSKSVLSSINMGVLVSEETQTTVKLLQRSSSTHCDRIAQLGLERLAHISGSALCLTGSYPGWEYRSSSPLQDMYAAACEKIYKKTPSFTTVHAGLECGIFYERMCELGKSPDIICIGPNLYDIHTTKERLDIASLDRFYTLLKDLLGNSI